MTDEQAHLSPFELDSLRLGRLAAGRAEEARGHVATCAACRRLEDGLRADQLRFENDVLPRTRAPLRARAEGLTSRWRRRRLWFVGLAPLVPAAALVMLLAGRPAPEPYLGIKGAASFTVVARRGDAVLPLASGARVAAGDGLRFVVDAPQPYVMILAVGAGEPRVYLPFDGAASVPLPPGRAELPATSSIVLDGAPGPHRLYALFSRQPIQATAALAAASAVSAGGPAAIRAALTLPIAGAEEQSSLLLEGPAR